MFNAKATSNAPSTVLRIVIDGVLICLRNGETSRCGRACISRSQLLQDIHDNSETGEEAQIPLSEDTLLQWVSEVMVPEGCLVIVGMILTKQVLLFAILNGTA